jgi:mannose-1-phosphate guanylyltransferase/mannose-1-phosphate guanylyltransferase/phosphomannomutase
MNNVTKAMIMAAGVGSRLDPLTKELPKPLVPITNKPVMDILLENLSSIGITKVIANTYYHADKIIDRYSNNNFGIDFSYITEQDLSGTAGGLKKCQYFFDKGETFVVLSGDGLTNANIQKGIKLHKNSNAIATIGIKKIAKSELSKFGVVVTDENGFITEFQEKPKIDDAKSDFINTGIYIFDYKIFDYIPEKTFYDFAKNVFPKLVKEHAINTFEISEYWSDIGTLEQYIQSTKDVINGICHVNENNLNLSDMPDSTKIEGYNVIGKNCTISKSAKLNNCIIWDNVEIAANTTISNSVIGNNSKIFCDVTDKIIGPNEVVENLAVNI